MLKIKKEDYSRTLISFYEFYCCDYSTDGLDENSTFNDLLEFVKNGYYDPHSVTGYCNDNVYAWLVDTAKELI